MEENLRLNDTVGEYRRRSKRERTALPIHGADVFISARPATAMIVPARRRPDEEVFRLELVHVLDRERHGHVGSERQPRAQFREALLLPLDEVARKLAFAPGRPAAHGELE